TLKIALPKAACESAPRRRLRAAAAVRHDHRATPVCYPMSGLSRATTLAPATALFCRWAVGVVSAPDGVRDPGARAGGGRGPARRLPARRLQRGRATHPAPLGARAPCADGNPLRDDRHPVDATPPAPPAARLASRGLSRGIRRSAVHAAARGLAS